MIATRRTGSNLLLGYLNSIPNTSFAQEILNKHMSYGVRDRWVSKAAVLRHIAYSINHCEHRICGAKLLRFQLEAHRITLQDLKTFFPRARFIILYRRSILGQFVSLKTAELTGQWLWTEDYKLPSSIHIETRAFEEYCGIIKAFYGNVFEHDWIRHCSVTLSYEDLAADPQKVFDETLFPFLNLPSSKVSCRLRKQNTKEPREIIANYHEIEPLVEYEWTRQAYPA